MEVGTFTGNPVAVVYLVLRLSLVLCFQRAKTMINWYNMVVFTNYRYASALTQSVLT